MNSINYVLFEIIKYKIEFSDCLEYALLNQTKIDKKEIELKYNFLKSELNDGTYKSIVSNLFTSYDLINKNLYSFIKKYKPKYITKMIKKSNMKSCINLIEELVNCEQTLTTITQAFLEEKEIRKELNKDIEDLRKISNTHFDNFLFFTLYNSYINCETNKIKISHKDFSRLIALLNYCNKQSKRQNSINILQTNNENLMYEELKKLSSECIKTEEKQQKLLKNIIKELENQL